MRASFRLISLAVLCAAVAAPFHAASSQDTPGPIRVMKGKQPMTPGSGQRRVEARSLAGFERLVVGDAVDVSVRYGPSYSVEVEADDNLLSRVETRSAGGILDVGVSGSYSSQRAPLVRITMPRLSRVELSASSSADIRGFRSPSLYLSSNGSGNFHVVGQASAVQVEMSGSGHANLSALDAGTAAVQVNGSGSARVRARQTLSAEVNGNGLIRYSGPATLIERTVHGPGAIRPDSAGM